MNEITEIKLTGNRGVAQVDDTDRIIYDGEVVGTLGWETLPTRTDYLAVDLAGNGYASRVSAARAISRMIDGIVEQRNRETLRSAGYVY